MDVFLEGKRDRARDFAALHGPFYPRQRRSRVVSHAQFAAQERGSALMEGFGASP